MHNFKSLLQYNKTPQHSIGPYGYKYADDGERVPPQITITFYPDLQLHPANYTYNNSDPPFQSTMGKKKRMISKTKKDICRTDLKDRLLRCNFCFIVRNWPNPIVTTCFLITYFNQFYKYLIVATYLECVYSMSLCLS